MSNLENAYDNCKLSDHITDLIQHPIILLPPPVSILPLNSQERRQIIRRTIILRIKQEKKTVDGKKGKKKKSLLSDPDNPIIKQALQSDDRQKRITAIQKKLERLELEKIWVIIAKCQTII